MSELIEGMSNRILRAFNSSEKTYGTEEHRSIVTGASLAEVFHHIREMSGKFTILNCSIIGAVNFEGVDFCGWLNFENCDFHGDLNLKHTKARSLYLRGCRFVLVNQAGLEALREEAALHHESRYLIDTYASMLADSSCIETDSIYITGLKATGLRLEAGFRFGARSSAGFIDLRAAQIKGDVILENSIINPDGYPPTDLIRLSCNTRHERSSIQNGCVIYARGANFESNVTIDACRILGELHLADAGISKSLYISRSLIVQPWDLQEFDHLVENNIGHYAIQGDRLSVGGRISVSLPQNVLNEAQNLTYSSVFPSTFIFGKVRLTGVQVGGAFVINDAVVHSNRKVALSFVGSTLKGMVSFAGSRFSTAQHSPGVLGTRAHIFGDFFLHLPHQHEIVATKPGFHTYFEEFIDTSFHPRALPKGLVDPELNELFRMVPTSCRNYFIDYVSRAWPTDLKGMNLQNFLSGFLNDSTDVDVVQTAVQGWLRQELLLATDQAIDKSNIRFVPRLTYSETNASFFDWNLQRTRRVDGFWCLNGIDLVDMTVNGAFHTDGAVVSSGIPNVNGHAAINGERSTIEGGLFLGTDFLSFGMVNFRRANIGGDLLCEGAVMLPNVTRVSARGDASNGLSSVFQVTFSLSGAKVKGNLDFSSLRIVQPGGENCGTGDSANKNMNFAVYANRLEVSGAAFFRNGFAVTGALSFVSAKISKSIFFEPCMVYDSFFDELVQFEETLERNSFRGRFGQSWRFDLESAYVQNTLSLRLMMSGVMIRPHDRDAARYRVNSLNNVGGTLSPEISKPQLYTLQELEGNIDDWLRDEEYLRTHRISSIFRRALKRLRALIDRALGVKPRADNEFMYAPDLQSPLYGALREAEIDIETRMDNLYRKIRMEINRPVFGRSWRKLRLFDVFRRLRWVNSVNDNGKIRRYPVKGIIDLMNATTDTYVDDFDFAPSRTPWGILKWSTDGVRSWPIGITSMLEGFRYKKFGLRGIDTTVLARARIEWLKTQYFRVRSLPFYQVVLSFSVVLCLVLFISLKNLTLSSQEASQPFSFLNVMTFGFSTGKFWNIFQWAVIGFAPFLMAGIKLSLTFKLWLPNGFRNFCSRHYRRLFDKSAASANETRQIQETEEEKDGRIPFGRFRSQPWLQAAKAFRDVGQEQQARRVLLSRERLSLFSNSVWPGEKILRQSLLITFGRGLMRLYSVNWFLSVYAIAVVVYHVSFDLNMMRPAEAVILNHLELPAVLRKEDDSEGDPTINLGKPVEKLPLNQLPAGYSTPRALIYALEVMTPGLPMRQENRWAACPSEYILRNYDEDPRTLANQTRLCRPLRPTSQGQKIPIGSDTFNPGNSYPYQTNLSIVKQDSENYSGQELFSGPCGGVLYEIRRALHSNAYSVKNTKEIVSEYYSSITIDLCMWGVELVTHDGQKHLEGRSYINGFFERDLLRQSTWMFIAYGWVLIGGLAISLSQILIRDA